MPLSDLIILLPCQGFDDFPTDLTGQDAEGLLAAWTACFHPGVLAALGTLPKTAGAREPSTPEAGAIYLVPTVSQGLVPPEFAEQVAAAGGHLALAQGGRAAIARQLREAAARQAGTDDETADLGPWEADFYALGFAYLQIELLTRQMRYASTLDRFEFQQRCVQAAEQAAAGESDGARERLAAAFDLLAQQRDHYYPVTVYLLDLSLLEPGTLNGERCPVAPDEVPQNVVLTGETLQWLAAHRPAALEVLRQGVAEGRIGLLTAGAWEVPWPWIPSECLLQNLRLGIEQFQRHLGSCPHGYGGRQAFLSPALPRLLTDLHMKSAWHMGLDGSRFPTSHQSKTTWEGWGGASVAAVARPPVDARLEAPFLRLARDLGESMDMDYVAMRCWVHWPDGAAPSLGDLRRAARYSPALGRFTTWNGLMDDSPDTGHWDRFALDEYQSARLASARTDPITGSIQFWRRWADLWRTRTLAAQLVLLGEPVEAAAYGYARLLLPAGRDAEAQQAALAEQAATRVAERLGFALAEPDRAEAWLLVNPGPAPCRTACRLPARFAQTARPGSALYASATAGAAGAGQADLVVDVPAMGFVTLGRPEAGQEVAPDEEPARIVDEHTLRNEFFEARVDEQSGGLRALRAYRDRTNRLSQQLAIRMARSRRGSGEGPRYSTMVCDRLEVVESTPLVGRIRTEGRLLDGEGQTLAAYTQEFALGRGSRVLQLNVQCELRIDLPPDRWEHYLASAWAWADESAVVRRSAHLAVAETEAQRLEAPLLVELDHTNARTAFFPHGCPYHRRVGLRRLDTLLVVAGESGRHFRLGIGVDIRHPLQQALLELGPPISLPVGAATGRQERGWLFHIDAPQVLATDWYPVAPEEGACGLRVHLQEISGQSAIGKLRTARRLSRARQVSLDGDLPRRLSVDDEGVAFEIAPYDLIAIDLLWGEST